MFLPYSNTIFSSPAPKTKAAYGKYFQEAFLPRLIQNGTVSKGALYEIIPNPMGRPAPDASTFLALLESKSLQCLQKSDLAEASGHGVSSLDRRIYRWIETPSAANILLDIPGPYILQAEAEPADIEEYVTFYREDHAPMMAKHPGYLRTTLYQLESVQEGQDEIPSSLMIVHEFLSFERLGSQITKDSTETVFARRVFGRVKSMKARTMKLVCSEGY
ncbi:hypothetical protein BDW59DRAFT_156324 [Aspergillus cavernicola]|uniref:EthD domain-containing protein n=1 Tax=Aspergillus cavernicola TaxID=176166 RepID=A0ABR4J3K5_9EURO